MAVPEFLNSFEQTGFSMWLRDSDSVFGFYFILLCHTLGLALLVGPSLVVDLRILGVAPGLPLRSLKRLFGIMWVGFVINAISGLLLLAAYPTKSLTNPTFYFKLSFIALGMIVMRRLDTQVFDSHLSEPDMIAKGKSMAKWSLILWFGAMTAGRLLAYTATYLLYGITAVFVFNVHR